MNMFPSIIMISTIRNKSSEWTFIAYRWASRIQVRRVVFQGTGPACTVWLQLKQNDTSLENCQ